MILVMKSYDKTEVKDCREVLACIAKFLHAFSDSRNHRCSTGSPWLKAEKENRPHFSHIKSRVEGER